MFFSFILNTCYWRDQHWVRKSIGILKRERFTNTQRLAIIDKAIIKSKPPKNFGVDELGWAEPSTLQVNGSNVATSSADIQYLNCVGGNTARQWSCGALVHHNVRFGTLFAKYSVWFHHCCATCVKPEQIRKGIFAINSGQWKDTAYNINDTHY